ncbi:unnamed protein product [Caenorhabditis brenneri]
MYTPTMSFLIIHLISLLLFLLTVSKYVGATVPPRRVNLYKWLAQNSYICDPTLLNKRSHRFLAPREHVRSRCSCGDPLITKAACGRKNGSRDKAKCFRLPDSCLQEYSIIFANGGNRLDGKPRRRPHPLQRTTVATRKRRPTTLAPRHVPFVRKRPHRMPKIVSTIPVTTVLRVRKQRKPS